MNIEIHKPELERRMRRQIESGHFHDVDELIEKAMGHKGKSVLGRHYRKLTDDDLLRLMDEDVTAHANLRAADCDRRATDGPIAQSVELRTFNP